MCEVRNGTNENPHRFFNPLAGSASAFVVHVLSFGLSDFGRPEVLGWRVKMAREGYGFREGGLLQGHIWLGRIGFLLRCVQKIDI